MCWKLQYDAVLSLQAKNKLQNKKGSLVASFFLI